MCELRVHTQQSKSSRQPVQTLREAETACSSGAAHSSPLLLLIHQGDDGGLGCHCCSFPPPHILPLGRILLLEALDQLLACTA